MATLITCEGVFSYPKLFVPVLPKKPKPGDVPAYETSLLFTAEGVETPEYKALVIEAERVGREMFGDKFDVYMRDGKLKWPFKRDIESAGYPDRFVRYISARAKKSAIHPPPQIVELVDGKIRKITDPTRVYPGVLGKISVSVYAFDGESRGVTFGLRNALITGDGERLDGSMKPGTEFGGEEDDAPAGGLSEEMKAMLG